MDGETEEEEEDEDGLLASQYQRRPRSTARGRALNGGAQDCRPGETGASSLDASALVQLEMLKAIKRLNRKDSDTGSEGEEDGKGSSSRGFAG
eukprot:5509906-Karenia_brevis.AAC.1